MVTGDEMGISMVSRKSKSGLLIILLTIVCFACHRYTAVEEVTWLNDFLYNPVCEPPCWENITPGITKDQEVEEALLGSGFISEIEISMPGEYYAWKFKNEEGDGSIWISEKTQLVSIISFAFGEKQFSFGSFAAALGEPTYVKVLPSPSGEYDVSLIYPDRGVIIGLGLLPGRSSVKLSANEEVFDVALYKDTPENLFIYRSDQWQEWKGFDVYYSVLGTP